MSRSLRHIFIHYGECSPFKRLGCPRSWLHRLPDAAVMQELDRRTMVLPRQGDGWYARPQTGVSDGFPWGQLTATGVQEMMRVGAEELGQEGRADRFMFRSAADDVAVQTAQALAVGVASARSSPHVAEVLLTRCEELEPASHVEQYMDAQDALKALGVHDGSGDLDTIVDDAASAIRANFPDSAPMTHTRESLCELLSSLGNTSSVDVNASTKIGNATFAQWAAPFHANSTTAMDVFGDLFTDVFRSIADAADDAANGAQWPDEDIRVYVVPAETLVALSGTLGLAPTLMKQSRSLEMQNLLGAWPSRGARLDIELLAENSKDPCVQFAWNGCAVSPLADGGALDWASFRHRFDAFLE